MKKVSIAVQKRKAKDVDPNKSVLVPVDGAREHLKAYHINQILHVTVQGEIDPRSLKQLALYWVCCKKVADNSSFPTDKDVDEYVKLKCHYVEWYYGRDGCQSPRTKSISFENMEQPDFNEFMDNAIPVMADILGCTEDQLISSQFDI